MLVVQESFRENGPRLYVCSTPIGNLNDVSFRLLETLRSADVIAAEDTRHTRKLLTRYEIHPPLLVSYHQHNRVTRARDLVRWWQEGKAVALVSDAGTPGISDPGEDAVTLAIEQGVPVIPVPGPSAVLSALVGSGFPVQPFTFVGFLPKENRLRQKLLKDLDACPGSLVFYEAPHRLLRILRVLSEHFPTRGVALGKELTKLHETFVRGDWAEVVTYLEEHDPRGEYVVILGPRRDPSEALGDGAQDDNGLAAAVLFVRRAMSEGYSHTEAVRLAVQQTGVRRKDIYHATLARDE